MNLGKRLIVFGGGALPNSGLQTFLGWAREYSSPRLLVVAWASGEPEVAADFLGEKLAQFGPIPIDVSLHPPTTAEERTKFLAELDPATGVFFSGGDQNRIAFALGHSDIRDAFHARYSAGVPFAGTSAGTAVMSTRMFAGDRDPGALDISAIYLRDGLGLCEGVIFDQHFLKRRRQNRLFAAVLRYPEMIGVGVDEGAGLAIKDGRHASVLGPEKVMRVEKDSAGRALSIELFHEGEEFDLFVGERITGTAS